MKVMFFSPHALADSCSGAARCVQTLLEELTRQGHSCRVLTGSVVDGPSHLFARALEIKPVNTIIISNYDAKLPVRQATIENVEHTILGSQAQSVADLNAAEEVALMQTFFTHFEAFQPDVVLTYGGFSSNYVAGRHAMSHGRKSVLFVATYSYDKPEHFQHVNRVIAVSKAMAACIAEATPLPVTTLSALVQKSHIVCKQRTAEFITFINPIASKGLVLAAAIAKTSQDRGKPYKFLFVEGRGTKADAYRECPALEDCSNVAFAANISDVRAVYERTSMILFPSLWFESAGRVPIEANANGIPVLAHNVGGVAEMLNGAGYLFDPPQVMLDNWSADVPADYLEKWLAVMDRLHNDPKEREDAERRAREADARYDVAALARTFASDMARL